MSTAGEGAGAAVQPLGESVAPAEKPGRNKALPTKKTAKDKGEIGGHDNLAGKELANAHQRRTPMPAKKEGHAHQRIRDSYEEKRGWIEFPKKGTKNPKRYAYKRRWIPDGKGGWKKSIPVRYRQIPPLSEEDYVKHKEQLERAKRIRQARDN